MQRESKYCFWSPGSSLFEVHKFMEKEFKLKLVKLEVLVLG